MLAAITYSDLSSQRGPVETADLDPGFITLMASVIRFVRQRRAAAADAHAANLIEASGGRLTDSVERRIAQSFV
jgi:hypothetical protein